MRPSWVYISQGKRRIHVRSYDVIVVTAGAVTRTLPVPGIAEVGFALKHVEEAVAVRDEFLTALDRAADLPKGSARTRALTVT